ncbi:MAG: DNA/RNA helicase domain-containing protein [Metamycoplasmataceae bacterium]
MIIYKNTIQGFIEDASNNDYLVANLISQMKEKVGYSVGEKEKLSWKTTLCKTSKIFQEIEPGDQQYILLEFKVPRSKKRIDIILVGKNNISKNLLIIELKGWSQIELDNKTDFIKTNTSYGNTFLHPAFQANDYKNILNNSYSLEQEEKFKVYSSAYLPNFLPQKDNNPLENKKYAEINNLIKTYTGSSNELFINYLKELFNQAVDWNEIKQLDKLEYKPSKSFIEHISNEFEAIELIDSQRYAFEKIKSILFDFLNTKKKTLITISGAAGSGKTIVAFKVLGLMLKEKFEVKLMLPGPEFRKAVKVKFGNNTISEFIGGADMNSKYNILIIDEGHKATSNGDAKSFYKKMAKKCNFLITLIDDMQVINKKGITRSQLEDIALEENFAIVNLDLLEHFRNGGDSTYIEWLKNWIKNEDNGQEKFANNYFDFKILNEKEFNSKYQAMYEEHNVRMLSFWTQTWNINHLENNLPVKNIKIGNSFYAWNPNWQWLKKLKNNNPNINIPSSLTKLCEDKNFNLNKKGLEYIGYFNTTQGSEFDYIFVHIPKLFFWNKETNKIDVDLLQLDYSEMESQVWATKRIKDNEEKEKRIKLNKSYFLNRLFVNLTRGTKGTFVYIEDKELEKVLLEKLIFNK